LQPIGDGKRIVERRWACQTLTGSRRERRADVVAFNGGEQMVAHVWRPEDDCREWPLTPERDRCGAILDRQRLGRFDEAFNGKAERQLL